jgi:dGTPase
MDYIWGAVRDFEPESMDEPADPFSAYVYSRISENYRRIFEAADTGLPVSYRRLQLVSDMVSGMTDSYALDFFKDLHNRHETNTLRQI